MAPRRRKWLPLALFFVGVVYGCLLLRWYNARLASTSQSSGRAAIRREQLAKVPEPVNGRETPTETEDPRLVAARLARDKQQEAEAHAETVRNFPRGEAEPRTLRDHSCMTRVLAGASGYCEVEDEVTGESFRVGRRYCNSIKEEAVFRCSDAVGFANFPAVARQAVAKTLEPGFALPNVAESMSSPRDGIVMVIYPRLLASAYASIRVLRELGCKLPIEIWYVPREMEKRPAALETLQQLAGADGMGDISLHKVVDFFATGFRVKVHAIYNSFFERVLFLDADNVPVRDPSFLFDLHEFKATGAVFWPDFWHPTNSIFNIHSQSLIWELLDIPFANMFEQESGQLLVDRRVHAARLELVRHYAFQRSDFFDRMKLVHGDKDLFRLAWLKQLSPFFMIKSPPAVAGKVINGSFCGMTMVQHDTEGNVLFLHRNSNKLTGVAPSRTSANMEEAVRRAREKLASKNPDGRKTPKFKEVQDELKVIEAAPGKTLAPVAPDGYPDPVIWTHLLSFRNSSRRAKVFGEAKLLRAAIVGK
uniref:Nucleotide-diphospho-sugar transferase domain-containing protein n=1 Tax=Phytophthora ramorum TaxID=164328 RepID=H3GDJ0_PHYRM